MTSKHSLTYKTFALSVAVFMVLATMPVPAAHAEPAAVAGSVTSIGSVQLRGVVVENDATLFAGDLVASYGDGYASLKLRAGHSVELGTNSAVTIGEVDSGAQLALDSGTVMFRGNGATALRLDIAPYEVSLKDAGAGAAGLTGVETLVVRSTTGSVLVRNTESQESFTLLPGQEMVFGLGNASLGEIASASSALPSVPLPSVPPAPQAGSGVSGAAMAGIVAAVGGLAAFGAFFAGRSGQVDESQVTTAQAATTTAQASLATAQTALSAAQASLAAEQAKVVALNATLALANAAVCGVHAQHIHASPVSAC